MRNDSLKLRILTFAMALFSWAGLQYASAAGRTMTYTVSFDTCRHYLHVSLDYCTDDAASDSLLLKMPVWAPGYYVIVDFPKYLSDFRVEDSCGVTVPWTKVGKNGWRIDRAGRSRLHVSYRIFANERSVAECRVERNMAFVAPNGVFMYEEGHKDQPVTVCYDLRRTGWSRISTGLKPKEGASTRKRRRCYVAPGFDVLYDSPVLAGNQFVDTFRHAGHDYELAFETPDGYAETTFASDFRRVVDATTRLMGDVPYDNYCLIHLGPGQGGLEHHNSQACYTDGTFRFADRAQYVRYLNFTTHEYFHLYNVKSIRPIELGPFDYDREVFTPLLWVSEGFTCYYEAQIMRRAGLGDSQYLLDFFSDYIRTVESREGHRHMSLRQSSYDIWLNFFNRAANGPDVRISYYDKGPVMGLLFDIEIRRQTGNAHSLDDLMRLLYNRYYKGLGRGFTEEEFWAAADEVAGTHLDLLRRYVDTTAEIDYETLLAHAGLRLDRADWTLSLDSGADALAREIRGGMGF